MNFSSNTLKKQSCKELQSSSLSLSRQWCRYIVTEFEKSVFLIKKYVHQKCINWIMR